MTPDPIVFLYAVSATAAAVAGLFFLRFRRETGDRLFAFFGLAFWLLALSWALLGIISPDAEARPFIYAIRLAAFLFIIVGMIDKNRGREG